MSKQDRQGVRTPADIERKYDLGKNLGEVRDLVRVSEREAKEARTAVTELDNKLNQAELINRLTEDGESPILYLADGTPYINASYIKKGVLKSADGKSIVLDLDKNTATLPNIDVANGERGTGILKVTTAPSSYTTAIDSYTPKYRIALSTVKSQSGVSEVLIGDIIQYSYYHYLVSYLDASYAYISATRTSIRGATGATGAQGEKGEQGEKGDKGDMGAQGIQGEKGEKGDKGDTGATGSAGADGYTPVKGTDYFTEADRAEMVNAVIAALPKYDGSVI